MTSIHPAIGLPFGEHPHTSNWACIATGIAESCPSKKVHTILETPSWNNCRNTDVPWSSHGVSIQSCFASFYHT